MKIIRYLFYIVLGFIILQLTSQFFISNVKTAKGTEIYLHLLKI
ncbi:hypothetical protein ABE099_02425 [Paenibacillus turicensis]